MKEELANDGGEKVSSLGMPMTNSQQEIIMNPGGVGPQVSVIIDTKKNYAPKQNVNRPEKSIRLMQERGLGGQRPSKALTGPGGVSGAAKGAVTGDP